MNIAKENEIQDVAREILADYEQGRPIDRREVSTQIDEKIVVKILLIVLVINSTISDCSKVLSYECFYCL